MQGIFGLCLLGSIQAGLSHSIKHSQADSIISARNTNDTALYYPELTNASTYRVINHDSCVEYPFIYVKLYWELPLALVVDTGVGAENGAEDTQAQELKDFIEKEIIPGHPAIQKGCEKDYEYLVFCTHCHFENIGKWQISSRIACHH